MHTFKELFDEILHSGESNGHGQRPKPEERSDREKLLDALEWEDTDSGKELEERGHLAEEAKRDLVG